MTAVRRPRVVMLSLDRGIRWRSKKGASVHLQKMARGFADNGLRVDVVAPDGFACDIHGAHAAEPAFTEISGLEVVRRFHAGDGREGAELEGLAIRAHVLEALLATHRDDPVDLVYERYSLFSDVGARFSEATGVPFALEVNAPLIDEQARYRELVMRRAAELVEKRQLHGATRVFAVSRPLGEWIASRGVSSERIEVLANTADRSEIFRSPFVAPASGEPFTVGFSGSLKPWHGVRWFLEVFARVAAARPQLRLQILGHGPLREELEKTARDLGVGKQVTFLGHVAHERVPDVIAAWDLVVAPYPPLDGFYFSPLKVVEALAAGRPVLASSIGDIPELLEDGRRGVLCPPGDATAWRRTLGELVDDPSRLVPPADRAERSTRGWSWTRHAEAVLRTAQIPYTLKLPQ